MGKAIEKILAKHGCLYMRNDYKALFEEIESYYKPQTKPLEERKQHKFCRCSDEYRKETCAKVQSFCPHCPEFK